jgi:signal peptidase II
MSRKHKSILSIALILFVIILDQLIKVWVKTNMYLGESIHITDWFQIRFIENNGMAFGWEMGGKYFLTSFRIVAVILIGIYIFHQIKKNASMGFIVCLSLILAGAAGNIFDCLFYGMIFNNPPYPGVAQLVEWGTGYSEFMLGRVVDMFYFPLVEWNMPQWEWLNKIAFLPDAGEHCIFFSPIFNFADASISCAIVALILFYHKMFTENEDTSHRSE